MFASALCTLLFALCFMRLVSCILLEVSRIGSIVSFLCHLYANCGCITFSSCCFALCTLLLAFCIPVSCVLPFAFCVFIPASCALLIAFYNFYHCHAFHFWWNGTNWPHSDTKTKQTKKKNAKSKKQVSLWFHNYSNTFSIHAMNMSMFKILSCPRVRGVDCVFLLFKFRTW